MHLHAGNCCFQQEHVARGQKTPRSHIGVRIETTGHEGRSRDAPSKLQFRGKIKTNYSYILTYVVSGTGEHAEESGRGTERNRRASRRQTHLHEGVGYLKLNAVCFVLRQFKYRLLHLTHV